MILNISKHTDKIESINISANDINMYFLFLALMTSCCHDNVTTVSWNRNIVEKQYNFIVIITL